MRRDIAKEERRRAATSALPREPFQPAARREKSLPLLSERIREPFWVDEVNRYALTTDATPICTTMSAVSGDNQPKSNGAPPAYAASFSFAAHSCSRLFSAA